MSSALQEGEIRTIVGEWTQVALAPPGRWDIPIGDIERRLRTLPRAAAWAISENGRFFWLLAPNQMLYTIEIAENGNVLSTVEQSLTGDTIVVLHSERPPRPYRDTENLREIEWTFGHTNGAPFLSLVGKLWMDRFTGRRRADRTQALAEAIAALDDE